MEHENKLLNIQEHTLLINTADTDQEIAKCSK